MKCIIFHKQGASEPIETKRNELALAFDMHVRDLKPVFSSRQLTNLSVKGRGIVLNLGLLKMVIAADKVYLFNVGHPEVSETFISNLTQAFKDKEMLTPFEFVVIEAALSQKFEKFKKDYDFLEKEIQKTLKKSENNVSNTVLAKLLSLKKRLSKFETAISEMNQSIMDPLENDEDLAKFYLSKKQQTQDTEEIESVLEFFAEPTEDIMHKIEDLKENIDDTQEFMALKLSTLRNTIIRFDLIATMLTAILSFLAVVAGIYGMNIRNNMEDNFQGFLFIVLCMATFGLFMFMWLWRYMKKQKIF